MQKNSEVELLAFTMYNLDLSQKNASSIGSLLAGLLNACKPYTGPCVPSQALPQYKKKPLLLYQT